MRFPEPELTAFAPTRYDPAATDPSGTPWAHLDPALLVQQRSSVKWRTFPAEVLPLFVAEMDFTIAPEIRDALIARIADSDLGYLGDASELAAAFADFARDRWDWEVPHEHVHLAADVAAAVVETLRVCAPDGGRLALATPVYPGFFEMLHEVPFELVQLPLVSEGLDLAAIERAFAAGVDVFLLCNPHNPHGRAHDRAQLTRLAELAAAHDVFVLSDEIHAPLTHAGVTFTPFAPLAAAAGARSVTVTSASKGWNLAGAKCALIVAADARAEASLQQLPFETAAHASLLGMHANVVAFRDARAWLDRAVVQIAANAALLAELVATQLPGVRYTPPQAGYLAWLDCRDAGLGDDPHARILADAKVALNNGVDFGLGGAGHVRLNLACAPATLIEAVRRIAAVLPRA